ncbi:glycosyltransferase family 2 protein [Pseudonocardia bannensis]|uniref:Glycosyltransferase family 2 protein n=1 Tax=Pseudonocardia bannensis TaxID=630973 RepID=A0A848DBK2_9PSEU|nr:glycosyltransferase family 2 protein [Pseudonocardia bannensis]NMH90137.1 glycosyltransferase family 2 protein [Pseudonocardia bannensis]
MIIIASPEGGPPRFHVSAEVAAAAEAVSAPAIVGVVVLAWQNEPWLATCVDSILASTGVRVELVVVDNGCRPEDLAAVPDHGRFRLLRPGRNLGFAGGCNLGVGALSTEFVALVNSDCVLCPDTLRQLVSEASRPDIGPVMASVRIADSPELINSAGNPVHIVGLSWAGGLYTRESRSSSFDVTAASGACVVVRRSVWTALGGFDAEYFAYVEDTELSLRSWQRGWAARCVPTAIALHHYEFSRNATKMYLLERNRLMMVATLWSTRALIVLGPLLLVVELLLAGHAVIGGWGRHKFRGWWWLWKHRAHLRARRREVQAQRTEPSTVWMALLTPDLDRQVVGSPALTWLANMMVRTYWQVARRFV